MRPSGWVGTGLPTSISAAHARGAADPIVLGPPGGRGGALPAKPRSQRLPDAPGPASVRFSAPDLASRLSGCRGSGKRSRSVLSALLGWDRRRHCAWCGWRTRSGTRWACAGAPAFLRPPLLWRSTPGLSRAAGWTGPALARRHPRGYPRPGGRPWHRWVQRHPASPPSTSPISTGPPDRGTRAPIGAGVRVRLCVLVGHQSKGWGGERPRSPGVRRYSTRNRAGSHPKGRTASRCDQWKGPLDGARAPTPAPPTADGPHATKGGRQGQFRRRLGAETRVHRAADLGMIGFRTILTTNLSLPNIGPCGQMRTRTPFPRHPST